MRKRIIFLVAFSALLLSLTNLAYGVMPGDLGDQKDAPEYVAGEILVKFKEGSDPQAVLQEVNLEAKSLSRIHAIKPAVNKFKKACELEKDSDGWYWFRGKNYKESEGIPDEEIFKEAYAGMSDIEKSLYRSYKLVLPERIGVEEAIARLEGNPAIEYAEPNYIARVQIVPNDPYYYNSAGAWGQSYDDLWGIKKIMCEEAWNRFSDPENDPGKGVIVAVVDTGVDYSHEDLAQNIWINPGEDLNNNGIVDDSDFNGRDDDENGFIDDIRGFDFAYSEDRNGDGDYDDPGDTSDPDPMDRLGHGTHCAGIIAAVGNNGLGVIGVAPNAEIMSVKGIGDSGVGNNAALVKAVRYAADNGAHVISNSWGDRARSKEMENVFIYANSKGCVSVAAAGNDASDVVYYTPAGLDTVMAVSASTQNDERCDFSNYGSLIDVAAPGGGYENELGGGADDRCNILSTIPDDSIILSGKPHLRVSEGYARLAGTSMACPHVAGLAALIRSKDPELTNEEVRAIIQMSADDTGAPGKDEDSGYGRINAENAYDIGRVSIAITSFDDNEFVRGDGNGDIYIRGSAFIENGFQGYELRCVSAEDPGSVFSVQSDTAVDDGLLGVWNTIGYVDGKYDVILTLNDTKGKEVVRSVEVILDNYNEPPVLDLTNRGVIIDKLLEFTVEAADPDDPETPWGQLTYAASGLPEGATFDPETQSFSWHPLEGDEGVFDITFIASDSEYTVTEKATLTTVYTEDTRITTDSASQSYASIYGDVIVWEDGRIFSGSIRHRNTDIFMFDRATGLESPVTTAPLQQRWPVIYGDKIVWQDNRNGDWDDSNWDIYMYDLSTGQETRVTYSAGNEQRPAIFGDIIVWDDGRSAGQLDIYMYNIQTGQETQITDDPGIQQRPSIYEDKIVWQDDRHGNQDIYMLDLSTGEESQITSDLEDQLAPAIYGDKIVWLDTRDGTNAVYMYDLSTGQQKRIFKTIRARAAVMGPVINGDKVVWDPYLDGQGSEICVYDISNDMEMQLTSDPGFRGYPAAYENKVVWTDTKDGNQDVYMAELCYASGAQITSAYPTVGAPGSILRLFGSDFGTWDTSSCKVEFKSPDGSIKKYATITSWWDFYIRCYIPSDIEQGDYKITVINDAGRSNSIDFKVAIPPEVTISYPASGATVPNNYFYFYGIAETEKGVGEVDVYIYDRGQRKGTFESARFYDFTQIYGYALWYFRVEEKHMTPGEELLLYVKVKDKEGIWSYWEYRSVKVAD